MIILSRIYDLVHPVLRSLRGNRHLIYWLFRVKIPRGSLVQFDPTTIGLSRLLCEIASPDDRCCLEIGIGQGALISLSIAKHHPMEIFGVDCSSDRVAQATVVAAFNDIPVQFFVSDLFNNVPAGQKFDLIFFNPPYVPTEIGQRLMLNKRFSQDGDQVWDGGPDGTQVLARFLIEAQKFLTDRGRIVFGVQAMFVPESLVQSTVSNCGLVLQKRAATRFPPCVCYVVSRESSNVSGASAVQALS